MATSQILAALNQSTFSVDEISSRARGVRRPGSPAAQSSTWVS